MPVVVSVVYRITCMYAAGMVLLAVKRGRQGYEATRRLREEDPEIRRELLELSARIELIS